MPFLRHLNIHWKVWGNFKIEFENESIKKFFFRSTNLAAKTILLSDDENPPSHEREADRPNDFQMILSSVARHNPGFSVIKADVAKTQRLPAVRVVFGY